MTSDCGVVPDHGGDAKNARVHSSHQPGGRASLATYNRAAPVGNRSGDGDGRE